MSLLWFAHTTSFNLNKSTNFRILRLGLNSFPLSFVRSFALAKRNLQPFKFIHQIPCRDIFLRVKRIYTDTYSQSNMPRILHVKNVNTFSMQKCRVHSICTAHSFFHPWQFFPHLISGDNKIKTYSSQHVNWFPACVREWAKAPAPTHATE